MPQTACWSEEVIVTAGGSTYFDVVADRLAGQWLPGHRLKVVLRSGAYLTHDHGFYLEHTPFLRVPEKGSLKAAIELWAQVTSAPEDGRGSWAWASATPRTTRAAGAVADTGAGRHGA